MYSGQHTGSNNNRVVIFGPNRSAIDRCQSRLVVSRPARPALDGSPTEPGDSSGRAMWGTRTVRTKGEPHALGETSGFG